MGNGVSNAQYYATLTDKIMHAPFGFDGGYNMTMKVLFCCVFSILWQNSFKIIGHLVLCHLPSQRWQRRTQWMRSPWHTWKLSLGKKVAEKLAWLKQRISPSSNSESEIITETSITLEVGFSMPCCHRNLKLDDSNFQHGGSGVSIHWVVTNSL